MIGAVHHVGFTVADLGRSTAFYEQVLGCEVVVRAERRGGFAAELIGYPGLHMKFVQVRPPGGAPLIELMEFVDPPTAPTRPEPRLAATGHVCLTVDDLRAEHERLQAAGAVVGAPQRMGDAGSAWTLYLRDPDGVLIQLLQPAQAP